MKRLGYQGGTEMRIGDSISRIVTAAIATLISVAVCMAMVMPAGAADVADAGMLVDRARITFNEFMGDAQFAWFHANLKDTKGLLIYPQVIKGGFIFGGSGGTGIFVVRDEKTGDWSQPAFYSIGSATVGLQIGGEASQIIVMVMSKKAVDSLLTSSLKFGGDTSVALGPIGFGAKQNIIADFVSFAKSQGLYAGINLEGSIVNVRDALNSAYYGKQVTPVDILIRNEVSNEGSNELRAVLKKAVK
jgi:lipid-binding SYLF domain-containing protein